MAFRSDGPVLSNFFFSFPQQHSNQNFFPFYQKCRSQIKRFQIILAQTLAHIKELKEFDAFIRELPILGYNSSKYDLPLIQTILIRELVEKIDFVI